MEMVLPVKLMSARSGKFSAFLKKPLIVLGLSIFSSTMPGCKMTQNSMR
jgi:hypothetical protein